MTIPVQMLEAPVLQNVQVQNNTVVFTMTDGSTKSVSLSQLRSGHNLPHSPAVIPPGQSNQGPSITFSYPDFGDEISYALIGQMRVDFSIRDDSGGQIVSMQYQLDNNSPVPVAVTPTALQTFSIPVPDLLVGDHKFTVTVTDNQGQSVQEFVRWLQDGASDGAGGGQVPSGGNCVCPVDPQISTNKLIYAQGDVFIIDIAQGRPNSVVSISCISGTWSNGILTGTLDSTGKIQFYSSIPYDAPDGYYAFKVAFEDTIVRLLEINLGA